MLENCGDVCGWTSVLFACLFKGSFGVPMKSEASERVNVDPLVFQTYKTIMFLLLSLIFPPLLLGGDSIVFSPWGIVSGSLWVPGGACGIYAVRKAGLAVSQGMWSSIIVLASFTWGVLIFKEEVRSVPGCLCAMVLMIFGLWGMSYFSSPTHLGYTQIEMSVTPDLNAEKYEDSTATTKSSVKEYLRSDSKKYVTILDDKITARHHFVSALGFQLSERQMGMVGAVINGITAGSMFYPIHCLDANTRGIKYSFSFALGALIVNITLWILRYTYHLYSTFSFSAAYYALPSFHFHEIWRPGCLSGLLWGSGNICSIVAVTSLGQGVGYSVIQSSMLISGLWGIFWYKEVTEPKAIMKWFTAAAITVTAIIWLSEEHIKS